MHITIMNYIIPQTFQDNKTDSQTNNPSGGAQSADNWQNGGYRQDNGDLKLLYAVPENLNPDDGGYTADKYDSDDGHWQDSRDLKLLYAVPENLKGDKSGNSDDYIYYPIYSVKQPAGTGEV